MAEYDHKERAKALITPSSDGSMTLQPTDKDVEKAKVHAILYLADVIKHKGDAVPGLGPL